MNATFLGFVTFLIMVLVNPIAHADTPELQNLTKKQAEGVIKDFGTNFVHTAVAPPSGASLMGLEVGLVAGAAEAPTVDEVSSEDWEYVPHAQLVAIGSFPLGLGAELNLLPETKQGGVEVSKISAAGTWKFSTLFPDFLLSTRARVFFGTSKLSYSDSGSVDLDVDYEAKQSGFDIEVSLPTLIFIEPYAGLGYISIDGDLKGTGTSDLYNFTSAQKFSHKESGMFGYVGVQFYLTLLRLSAEYMNVLDNDVFNIKASVGFDL